MTSLKFSFCKLNIQKRSWCIFYQLIFFSKGGLLMTAEFFEEYRSCLCSLSSSSLLNALSSIFFADWPASFESFLIFLVLSSEMLPTNIITSSDEWVRFYFNVHVNKINTRLMKCIAVQTVILSVLFPLNNKF